MRFLNGLLGAFAGLMASSMIIAALIGTFHTVGIPAYWIFHFVIALLASAIMVWREKPEWTWARYAVSGVYSAGTILACISILILAAVASHFGASIPAAGFIMAFVPAMISGICTGIGYRALAGAKAAPAA